MPTITVSFQVPDGPVCLGCPKIKNSPMLYFCSIFNEGGYFNFKSDMRKTPQCLAACQAAENPTSSTGKIIKNLFLELNRLREITGVSERRDEG